jgi:hypothetical protein
MPVTIAGMHRSGTSMVARLLNLCGLDLGPDDQLLPPAPDNNPEGFWEHKAFVAVNDELLQRHHGTWHSPPDLDAGWEADPDLADLAERAAALACGFRDPWGWKDPRTSLTLPFWQRAWPDLGAVICVRNPVAVAQSLLERDGFTYLTGLRLWLAYNRALLDAAPPGRRVVTHYETYFRDPEAELRRVLGLLGLPTDDEQVRAACATVKPDLRHSRITVAELERLGVPAPMIDCYARLSDEAGEPPTEPATGPVPRAHYSSAVRLTLRLEEEVEYQRYQWHGERGYLTRGFADQTAALVATRAERDAVQSERDAARAERDAIATQRDAVTAQRDGVTAERDTARIERDTVTAERDAVAAQRNAVTTERDDLRAALVAAAEELARRQAAHRRELADRDAELAATRATLAALQAHADQFAGLTGVALRAARMVQAVRNRYPRVAASRRRAVRRAPR